MPWRKYLEKSYLSCAAEVSVADPETMWRETEKYEINTLAFCSHFYGVLLQDKWRACCPWEFSEHFGKQVIQVKSICHGLHGLQCVMIGHT